jgi:hypothetical protein
MIALLPAAIVKLSRLEAMEKGEVAFDVERKHWTFCFDYGRESWAVDFEVGSNGPFEAYRPSAVVGPCLLLQSPKHIEFDVQSVSENLYDCGVAISSDANGIVVKFGTVGPASPILFDGTPMLSAHGSAKSVGFTCWSLVTEYRDNRFVLFDCHQ